VLPPTGLPVLPRRRPVPIWNDAELVARTILGMTRRPTQAPLLCAGG